jgi:flagellar basal-body rod protein FlgC
MSEFSKAMSIAASGMLAQNVRLRVISENIANAESVGTTPGSDPYRRKTVSFRNRLDRELGANLVKLDQVGRDRSAFPIRNDPSHPAADADGRVKMPNVNSLIELMDLRQAQRSYQANLRVVDVARTMVSRTIELLR